MKRIWLVNQYAMPPHLESRLRTIKFAQYLTDMGYDVTIFASSVMHNMGENLIKDGSPYMEANYGKIHFVHINTRAYKKSFGIDRIISSFQFTRHFIKYSKRFPKPDVIVQTSLVPFGNGIAGYAKSLNCRYIVEVLDLWPRQLVVVGKLKEKNILLKLLYKLEEKQYKAADELVFSMEGGKDYVKDRKLDKEQGGPLNLEHVHYINNGVDLTDFDRNKSEYIIDDPDLKNPSIKKAIYLGSIRRANSIIHLINAAEQLKEHKDIYFFIYGDGDERQSLIDYCEKNGVKNVVFKEKWIDPKYVPYVVSSADLNVLNYTKGFGHYGGSQSKMFQYLASGKPICCNLDMRYNPIKKYNVGISKSFESPREYAQAILSLLSLSEKDYAEMCTRARQAAEEYDYPALTQKLVSLF